MVNYKFRIVPLKKQINSGGDVGNHCNRGRRDLFFDSLSFFDHTKIFLFYIFFFKFTYCATYCYYCEASSLFL